MTIGTFLKIGFMLSVIGFLLSVICYLLSVICYLLSVICYPILATALSTLHRPCN